MPSHAQLESEIQHLTYQQQKHLAEQEKANAQNNELTGAEEVEVSNAEIDAYVATLNLDPSQQTQLAETLKKMNEKAVDRKGKLKTLLKSRKDRNKERPIDVEGLSDDDKKNLLAATKAQVGADRLNEDNALLNGLRGAHLEEQRKVEEETLRKTMKGVSEGDIRNILEELDKHRVQAKVESDRNQISQRDALLARLEAKRKMKEELLKEESVSEELDHIVTKQAEKYDKETEDIVDGVVVSLKNAADSKDRKDLVMNQEQAQADMDVKYRQKLREMEEGLEKEEAKELRQIENQLEDQKRLAVDAKKTTFDRDMLLHGKGLSDDDFQKMMKQHEKELNRLNGLYDTEKIRQKKALEKKIAQRKKTRGKRLKEDYQLALNKELSAQQTDRDKAHNDAARAIEDKLLKEKLKDNDDAENLVYTVLRQRHMRDAVHLEERLAREKDAAISEAKALAAQHRAEDREKLENAHEKELTELVANNISMSGAELQQKIDELNKKYKQQMREYDSLTDKMIASAGNEVEPQIEIEQTNARLTLKEKHVRELANAMNLIDLEADVKAEYEKAARDAEEEARRFRESTMVRMQKELEEQKAEARKKDEERRLKIEQEMKDIENQLALELQKEAEELTRREAEREDTRKKQLEEKAIQERQAIEAANVSEDERKKLLDEHSKNLERLNSTLSNEKEKVTSALNGKL